MAVMPLVRRAVPRRLARQVPATPRNLLPRDGGRVVQTGAPKPPLQQTSGKGKRCMNVLAHGGASSAILSSGATAMKK
eukprot:9476082-Pyramimonas_sp.AAC.1